MSAIMRAAALAAVVTFGAAQNLPSNWQGATWGVAACSATGSTDCCCATLANCGETDKMVCEIKTIGSSASSSIEAQRAPFLADANQLWIILCGALVFFMQCGFAMLEAGSVRVRNTQNIIFKNLIDICIGALGFFSVGFAFAYGDGSKEGGDAGRFIGANNFFLMKENNDESGQHLFFFQFAFAATAATIVSGSVAERTKITAYFIYSVFITTFVYPVVVHWVWSAHGWLSAFAPESERLGPNGMIDYAGSGVVHAVGGWAGLCGAFVVGPRRGRFHETKDEETGKITYGEPLPMPGQSTMMASLGVLILWFGWYGFNCGSTLAFDGENAGKVATTTTLAAAMGGFTTTIVGRIVEGHWPVSEGLNGVLAGLVSITAGCSVVDEWAAIFIGAIGGVLYFFAAKLLLLVKIDDPLGAWPVHGACGVWGCLAVGIWAQQRNIERAYPGLDGEAASEGKTFVAQLAGIAAIVGWTVGLTLTIFFTIDKTIGMRISEEEEEVGLDVADHGGKPTATWCMRHPANPTPADQMVATMFSQPAQSPADDWRPSAAAKDVEPVEAAAAEAPAAAEPAPAEAQ